MFRASQRQRAETILPDKDNKSCDDGQARVSLGALNVLDKLLLCEIFQHLLQVHRRARYAGPHDVLLLRNRDTPQEGETAESATVPFEGLKADSHKRTQFPFGGLEDRQQKGVLSRRRGLNCHLYERPERVGCTCRCKRTLACSAPSLANA